ncbi:sterol desaturase family protein [Marinilongibacter aquaticus]|nr:sterol desaturase family protein [Marinilongibacter aquaticus]
MESIAQYFDTIPSSHRSYILFGGLAFFLFLENVFPLVNLSYKKGNHLLKNIFFTLTTALVNLGMAFILLASSHWAIQNHFGILEWFSIDSLWLQALIGLLVLDLIGAYFIHWIQHKVKWMWKFHIIHHSDQYVDASTANRHHPGESVFRFVFTCLAVLVCGAPLWLILMYQSLSAIFSQFNHANLNVPKGLSKILGWVFVTPEIHRSHHHYVLPYTNSNYGNLFSIWDRLFGTYIPMKSTDIVFGVDTHMDPKENDRIGNLLKIPFEPYRPPSTKG